MWEGGVKAVGFVYNSNGLIKQKKRVCTELIDATDWLPTLYHLAGGDAGLVSNGTDGMNVWQTIANGVPSPRKEILHNIDPRYMCFPVGGERKSNCKSCVYHSHNLLYI